MKKMNFFYSILLVPFLFTAEVLAQEQATSTPWSGLFGGSSISNPNISLVVDTVAYASNLSNDELKDRDIPFFTTNGIELHNGFNFRVAELSLYSPVDPYFTLYTNIPMDVNGISVEEAYVVTTSLPAGLQIKGGRFKSNFSRLDAQHMHAWDFSDIALPYRAFLGPEGLGGENGIQLTYLPALSVYLLTGIEVLQGENDLLFGQDASQWPHAFSVFIKSSLDTGDYSTIYFGPSVLFGKTRNTNVVQDVEVDANSTLYDMEAVWKWKPSNWQDVIVQGEYLLLNQYGDAINLTTLSNSTLKRIQDGFYIQGIYRIYRWKFGSRYDMLAPFFDTFKMENVQQNLRGKPERISGIVQFNPSEFTYIRLQFSQDNSVPGGRVNNEVFLQFDFTIGAHPAHTF
ncbi:MAG: hypothetical protein ACP5JP_06165 [bacterium]